VRSSSITAARKLVGLVLVVGLTLAAACGRSGGETEDATEDPPEGSGTGGASGSGGGDRLANGEFGDLGTICQDGDPGATPDEPGITDDEIRIGTITDKGAEVRAGLTQEMYDTAVAFADWCNEHGGLNGREVVVDDLDARLTEYPQRIEAACQEDFALVGGGGVFDNTDNGQRVDCGLINIAGYAVTPEARVADLQVQVVPTPVHQLPVQHYRRIQEMHPDVTRFGLLWVDFAGVSTVHQQVDEAVTTLGFDVVFDQTYAPIGEQGWQTFVQNMRDADVQAVELIGEPENLTSLFQAMQAENWYPEVMTLQVNMLDQRLIEEAGDAIDSEVYVRSSTPTFDMDGEIPGMADYLELMESYNPDGRYPAVLGTQSLSALLLFATAVNECGDEVTRQCVMDAAAATEEWTAGGLHAPSTPGNADAIPCGILVRITPDGFVYDEEATEPDDGIWNCARDNVLELSGDYGVAPPEE
jgi:hypothetical protein